MARLEFKFRDKDYIVETKPLTQELFKKYYLPLVSAATLSGKIDGLLEKAEDLETIEKLQKKSQELYGIIAGNPSALGMELTESLSVNGIKQERPLTLGEASVIWALASEYELPSEEELKNLGSSSSGS